MDVERLPADEVTTAEMGATSSMTRMAGMDELRPRASLGRLIDDLGSTLLELIAGLSDETREISEVIIHDPGDEHRWSSNALVLGVGLNDPDELCALLDKLGGAGVACLVIKHRAPPPEKVISAAVSADVCLLGLNPGVSWNQVAAVLRSLTADSGPSGSGHGDLFALANALTDLLDAPVTIEDRSSRVVAFSGRQDEADAPRIESILGRQVPARFTKRYETDGIFRELYSSGKPVFVDADSEQLEGTKLPRVAIAVRAGEEILGSIWVAVHSRLDDDRMRALEDAAKLVALEMMKVRAGSHVQRRLRADLVAAAVAGGPEAAEAAERLGVGNRPAVVLALALLDEPEDVDSAAAVLAERERIGEALSLHLSAVSSRSVAAVIGDYCFGIIPVKSDASGDDTGTSIAANFLDRLSSSRRVVIGLGSVAADVAGLERSRQEAERAVRVLRSRAADRQVARLRDVQPDALVLEMADRAAARREVPTGPIERLEQYDAQHDAQLVETLQAWLDHFGDVPAAARAVYTHSNTFRYRLRRVAEVGAIDLEDPDQRFAAMLQLRIWPRAT